MNGGQLEGWERELMADHRWGKSSPEVLQRELSCLRAMRSVAGELNEKQQAIVAQVIGPEICNWALFETIARVCSIIGRGEPDVQGTGHVDTLTPQRWRRIWAYYLACRQWLSKDARPNASYGSLLDLCDTDGSLRKHITKLLGPRDPIKDLYVERFCICMEAWLGDLPPQDHPHRLGLQAAADALEHHIRQVEPELRVPIDKAMRLDDHSILQPCHHKLFRRYDIILSSIGDGRWRKSMPRRGLDGFDRADELEPYLAALERWVDDPTCKPGGSPDDDLFARLGAANPVKRFEAALLASLLRAQQESARRKAKSRQDKNK